MHLLRRRLLASWAALTRKNPAAIPLGGGDYSNSYEPVEFLGLSPVRRHCVLNFDGRGQWLTRRRGLCRPAGRRIICFTVHRRIGVARPTSVRRHRAELQRDAHRDDGQIHVLDRPTATDLKCELLLPRTFGATTINSDLRHTGGTDRLLRHIPFDDRAGDERLHRLANRTSCRAERGFSSAGPLKG